MDNDDLIALSKYVIRILTVRLMGSSVASSGALVRAMIYINA